MRDKIPELIKKREGKKPRIKKLTAKEFKAELLKKLVEEAHEAVSAKNSQELTMELADIAEVIDAIVLTFKLSRSDMSCIKKQKKKERGGFAKQIYLKH